MLSKAVRVQNKNLLSAAVSTILLLPPGRFGLTLASPLCRRETSVLNTPAIDQLSSTRC